MSKSRRGSGRMGPVGIVGACALGLACAGFVRARGHGPAVAAAAPPPPPVSAGDTPWGLIVVALVALIGLGTVVVIAFRRLHRPTVVQRWTQSEAVEAAAEPQPAIEGGYWHYILDGRTEGAPWVELTRGYVEYPAVDHRAMAAEVVRRALERQPEGVFRARVTPAVRQETPL